MISVFIIRTIIPNFLSKISSFGVFLVDLYILFSKIIIPIWMEIYEVWQ